MSKKKMIQNRPSKVTYMSRNPYSQNLFIQTDDDQNYKNSIGVNTLKDSGNEQNTCYDFALLPMQKKPVLNNKKLKDLYCNSKRTQSIK